MVNTMRRLRISTAAQANIDQTWKDLEEEEWLLIEREALTKLKESVEAKVSLLSLHDPSELQRGHAGFEQTEIDDVVLEAAFWVLDTSRLQVARFDYWCTGDDIDIDPLVEARPKWIFGFINALHLHIQFKKLLHYGLLKLASLEDVLRVAQICACL
jgi:hypothetical protein